MLECMGIEHRGLQEDECGINDDKDESIGDFWTAGVSTANTVVMEVPKYVTHHCMVLSSSA